jgi:hypothetical protein
MMKWRLLDIRSCLGGISVDVCNDSCETYIWTGEERDRQKKVREEMVRCK